MNKRLSILKTILWAIVGMFAVITIVRFARGLGATTALSDASPWGFWIAFDVMAGVALAAGGFVMAATVYIFGRGRYREFARPSILTAFLGYVAVVVGLLYDLGLPWNVWHPIVYPQHHSVLFEVAMCVMLYLSVLFMEFGPTILEHPVFRARLFQVLHTVLKKLAIPLVISGIVLSTLHQSSLGSLFLIAPHRVHPLWYSPIIWVLYFISAVGLGFMMVTAESFFSAWAFKHKLKMDKLAGLGRAAALVLLLYSGLRLIDLAARGVLPQSFDGSWQAGLFWFELGFAALVPAVLLLIRRIRSHPLGLGISSFMVVFGMIGYRFNTCIVTFTRPEGMPYFPSWMEVAVSVGIVASAMLVFIFFVERLRVYPDELAAEGDVSRLDLADSEYQASTIQMLMPRRLAEPRRFSAAAITAAALAIAFIPGRSLWGALTGHTPVQPSRTAAGYVQEASSESGLAITLAQAGRPAPAGAVATPLTLIDGNRDGRVVLFAHDNHVSALGGKESCGGCHHMNMPFDRNSNCYECHRDMYTVTDIFSHTSHLKHLNGNESCGRCHTDSKMIKNRTTAISCQECHAGMPAASSRVVLPAEGLRGYAPGYMDAMHGLCVDCHQEKRTADPFRFAASFDNCEACHRDPNLFRPRQAAPYLARRGGKTDE